MVPHLTIEQRICEVLDLHPAAGEGPPIAVMGVPDDKKGESLVLLATFKIEMNDLRKRLLERGLTSLWIPKVVKVVLAIPILASGQARLEGMPAPGQGSRVNVLGTGIDIVETKRIAESMERFGERFLRRVFCDGEVAYARSMKFPHLHLAARLRREGGD
ncbi:MAG: hypothetical protein WDO13_02605 [Verrucomicrobiota bacterium]